MPIQRTCAECGTNYWVKPAHAARSRYCSRACKDRPRRLLTANCRVCGKAFTFYGIGQQQYCSYPCAMLPRQGTLEQRFLQKVVCKLETGCWIWQGDRNKFGYGMFGIKSGGPGANSVRAHRLSYELFVGPIPSDLNVLHNCPGGDNPSCVRPDHLFLGTKVDNAIDMLRKGRGTARFSTDTVRAIRAQFGEGLSQRKLAKAYLTNPKTIADIVYRRTYVWVH